MKDNMKLTHIAPAAALGVSLLAGCCSTAPSKLSFREFDRRAAEGTPLTVAFIGGSLTWGACASNPQLTSSRALIGQYLQKKYPASSFNLIDAAIGGTGSQLGIFRMERDVMRFKPDLIFLDFTVNDGLFDSSLEPLVSYETILRRFLKAEIPVVQVFFPVKKNLEPGYKPEPFARHAQHLALQKYYKTANGDGYTLPRTRLASGELKLSDAYQPQDGTHPDDAGYAAFADGFIAGFEEAIKNNVISAVPEKPMYGEFKTVTRRALVEGTLPANWTRTKTFRTGMWFDGQSSRWMGDTARFALEKGGETSPLTVKFNGVLFGLFGEGNEKSLDFLVRIDGRKFNEKGLLVDDLKGTKEKVWDFSTRRFGPAGNLFMWRCISDRLPAGEHTAEIIPVLPAALEKGELRIESVCFAE